MFKTMTATAALALALGAQAAQAAQAVEPTEVLDTYVKIAEATYSDSLATAEVLREKVEALIAAPTEDALATAKAAWKAARVPYQQSEVYRFGNAVVDDWEGKVNAWPLDEGLIDYVDGGLYGADVGENPFAEANVIANPKLVIAGKTIDASKITPTLLSDDLHEVDGIEANVATGYHAIEFLLWGQDLNGTGPGAGARPATDFDTANCTGGHCDRRAAYLKAVTDLLVSDLKDMVAAWSEGGEGRTALLAEGPGQGLRAMVMGMGSLSYGELGGERMKLGLMLHDPEEEHDCFSDNTAYSHYYDAKGIRNVYSGTYARPDGKVLIGPSLHQLVAAKDEALAAEMDAKLEATEEAMSTLVSTSEDGEAYDQMIGMGNAAGNAKVQAAVDALVDQTKTLEKVIAALDIPPAAFEGSDSLDAPETVGN
ncbi:MAG: peptidase [Rhodospirillum sp.]|nr:peptidase [Rhodospirillum sp.]MCF8492004.1 peptidase [Rhodospirillum sp.]MCF8503127.1 peptidase [Rhodospirillum sp.]